MEEKRYQVDAYDLNGKLKDSDIYDVDMTGLLAVMELHMRKGLVPMVKELETDDAVDGIDFEDDETVGDAWEDPKSPYLHLRWKIEGMEFEADGQAVEVWKALRAFLAATLGDEDDGAE